MQPRKRWREQRQGEPVTSSQRSDRVYKCRPNVDLLKLRKRAAYIVERCIDWSIGKYSRHDEDDALRSAALREIVVYQGYSHPLLITVSSLDASRCAGYRRRGRLILSRVSRWKNDGSHRARWFLRRRTILCLTVQPLTDEKAPRVVYINHVARLSGGEIALERLLRALAGSVEAHAILGEDGPLVERLQAAGAEVWIDPIAPEVREARKEFIGAGGFTAQAAIKAAHHAVRLQRHLRELDADLVHTNSLKSAFYGGLAARAAGLPVLWHIRDRIADDYLPRRAIRLFRLAACLIPTAIVANSNTTLMTLRDARCNRSLRGFVFDPVEVPPLVHRSTTHVTVGLVGRLARWKGQHVFLEAFADAFRGIPVRGRIIGSAMFGEERYEMELRRQALRLGLGGQIEFCGFSQDIWSELSRLDILVHASITPEPFGQVIVEGMAAGLPVVAAGAGGPTELIEDGVNGLLFPPGDALELARILRMLADNKALRERLGERARNSVGRFSPEESARSMLRIYNDVLGR